MGDKPFRVLLDLTDLRIKCLKYVWMNVLPHELKTIAEFKESVIHKLNLEKVDIKLYVRNGLLLDDETVMILREDDTVKIHYQSEDQSNYNHVENCVKEDRKSGRKRNYSETERNLSLNAKKCKTSKISTEGNEILDLGKIIGKKERKHKQSSSEYFENPYNQSKTFEGSNSDTINFHKNGDKQISSEKNMADFNLLQKSDSFFSVDNQDNSVEGNESTTLKSDMNIGSNKCLKLVSAKDSLPVSDFTHKVEKGLKKLFDVNTESIKKSEELVNSCPKKKRKRRKKRKQVIETVVLDAIDNTEESRQFQSFTTEVCVPRKHIRYSSSPSKNEENILLKCDDNSEKVKNLTLSTSVMVQDVSNAPVKPCSSNYPQTSTPAQSDIYKNPSWCLPLIQKMDLNSHNNKTAGSKKEKNRSYVYTKSADEQSISFENPDSNKSAPHVSYADLPPLNSRPSVGAHIAYKILELDEHYSPVISDYREGIVKSINLDNEEIEIEFLKHEIKPGRTGKFENLKDDEVPLPEIKTCDTVRWSALLEPKLVVD